MTKNIKQKLTDTYAKAKRFIVDDEVIKVNYEFESMH